MQVWILTIAVALQVWGLGGEESSSRGPQGPTRPRNVLFLFADDMQAEAIAALGHPVVKTPNLDRLVQEGFTFRQCYIMGSVMPAVCVPSRAMLWGGRGLWKVPTDLAGTMTLPQWLREHGFETFVTGKWHNGRPSLARSFSQGAAIFFGGMGDHFKVPVFDFDPTGKYPPSARRIGEKFSSELFADAAIEFLRDYRGEKPFFALVSFTAPHDPRTPPGEYARMYSPEAIPLPGNFLPEHPFDNGELRVRDELLAPFPRTPEIIRQHLADYYGMISHLDAQIGRILQTLQQTPFAAETLVVFAADNGLAVGQHGLLGKQNLYEHSIRVPLILQGPGIPRGQSRALVYLHDVFPTLCELLGVPVPAGVEAQSLVPILRGSDQTGRPNLVFAYRSQQRAIRQGDWKLIRYRVEGKETLQLFNLREDPEEKVNLADDPRYETIRNSLLSLLEKELEAAGDPDLPR